MKTATLTLALLALGASTLSAQEPSATAGTRGNPPATLEGRLGWDYRSEAPALGLALRLPLFDARADLLAGGEAVFRDGLTEAQGHVDALLAFGGRDAIVIGGGPVVLRSVFAEGGEKQTRWGWGAVAGLRRLPDPGRSIGLALELRWLWVDDLEPRYFTLAIGLPLFRMPF